MAFPWASRRPDQYLDSKRSFRFLSINTSILDPLDLTGKVETFSGGARLPKIIGPRIGGNGHQSPTTSPDYTVNSLIYRKYIIIYIFSQLILIHTHQFQG